MSYMHHICGLKISIHAPRAGSDNIRPNLFATLPDFNPRSPCGERLDLRGIKIGKYIFQSTLPVRGATAIILIPVGTEEFQSTLPVRGATIQQFPANAARKFQSTLPVRGATITRFQNISNPIKFQSTLPVRGATKSIMEIATLASISIHAPRAGSDTTAR